MLGRIFNKSSNRPVMDMTRTYWDWFFDAASLVGLILMVSILFTIGPGFRKPFPPTLTFPEKQTAGAAKALCLFFQFSGLALYAILTVVGFFPIHTIILGRLQKKMLGINIG